MTRLALDLGTTTGYAMRDGSQLISGSVSFANSRYEGGGMRYLKFRRWLDQMAPSEVVFEEVRRHAGTDAAHVYGGFMATLTAWCEDHGVPYAGHPVGTIKKFATGKGNASKEEMGAVLCVRLGRTVGFADDNESDAIWLLLMVESA